MTPRTTLVALVVGAAGLTSVGPADGASDPCRKKGARVVLQNSVARVLDARETVYACLKGHRPIELGTRTPEDSSSADILDVRRLRLAGHYVAWEDQCNCPDFPRTSIFVRNLRSRRLTVKQSTLTSQRFGPTTALRLTRTGAVAWIAEDVYAESVRREVRKVDAEGTIDLDAGDAIGRSMSLDGSTISWLSAGERRSATLK
jgi:hypothetical protein